MNKTPIMNKPPALQPPQPKAEVEVNKITPKINKTPIMDKPPSLQSMAEAQTSDISEDSKNVAYETLAKTQTFMNVLEDDVDTSEEKESCVSAEEKEGAIETEAEKLIHTPNSFTSMWQSNQIVND